jgi:hypothetical protein
MNPQLLHKIDKKMKQIVDDLTFNVTHVYERDDMLTAILLTYFSPLEIIFSGDRIRGWLDICLFGESQSGKSTSVEKLWHFTNAGGMNRGKATYAGLVGGIDKQANGNVAKSGFFSNNNRGLVIIDEMQSISQEDLERMTDVRSSGISQIVGIRTIVALAKCRKIWIANPRKFGPTEIINFSNGPSPVQLFKYLIGTLEDMTRFDLILGFKMTGEGLSEKYKNVNLPNLFTKEVLRAGLNVAWALTENDVKFTEAAEQACYTLGSSLVKAWATDFPIVVSASQHLRLARLAAALATLVRVKGPGADIKTVVVYPEHVQWIHDWLVHLFKTNDLRYEEYVRAYRQTEEAFTRRKDVVMREIRSWKSYRTLLSYLSTHTTFTIFNTEQDIGQVPAIKQKFRWLMQAGLVRRGKDSLVKTQEFQTLLRTEFKAELDEADPLPIIRDSEEMI